MYVKHHRQHLDVGPLEHRQFPAPLSHNQPMMQTQAHSRELANYNPRWGRLAGDFAAAGVSATLVSPAITIIDRALTEKVSMGRSIVQGLRSHTWSALTHPKYLFTGKPFRLIWTLYAATYAVANSSDTLATEFHEAAASSITFISTMVVNVPLGVLKDLRFAQIYGASTAPNNQIAVKSAVPKAATGAFLLRDAITIFGSFTMAPMLSSAVPDSLASNPHVKSMVSQLTVPVLSQLGATPIHLLGLDLYNRQHGVMFGNRVTQIRRDLPSATFVRCVRIIPAFGLGGIVNIESRSAFHRFFDRLLN